MGCWLLAVSYWLFSSCLQLIDECRQIEFLVLAEHIIDALYVGDLVGFELGIAARDDEDGIGMLPPDAVDDLTVLMIGSIGDGAGVDDAYIRMLAFAGTCMPAFQQRLAQGTALRKIELAA